MGKAVKIPRLAALRGPATSSTYLYFVRFRSWLPRAWLAEFFNSFTCNMQPEYGCFLLFVQDLQQKYEPGP